MIMPVILSAAKDHLATMDKLEQILRIHNQGDVTS